VYKKVKIKIIEKMYKDLNSIRGWGSV